MTKNVLYKFYILYNSIVKNSIVSHEAPISAFFHKRCKVFEEKRLKKKYSNFYFCTVSFTNMIVRMKYAKWKATHPIQDITGQLIF